MEGTRVGEDITQVGSVCGWLPCQRYLLFLEAASSLCQLRLSGQGSHGCFGPSQWFMLPAPSVGRCLLVGLSSPLASAETLPPRAMEMWGEPASLHPSLFSDLVCVPRAPPTSSRLSPYSVSLFSSASKLLGTYIRLSQDFFSKGPTGSVRSKPAARDEIPPEIPCAS